MLRDPEELRRRLEANPADQPSFSALRELYAGSGHDAALADLLEYRATYGTYGEEAADLFYEAGSLWLDRLGDDARGFSALTRALEKHPPHRRAGDRLDAIYRERGDTASLVQLLEQRIDALEDQDPGPETARLRAHFHQQLGETWEQAYGRQDQAITHFRRAFELDPSNVMALYCAREIYQRAGNFETAAKLLDLEARAEQDSGRRVALYRELAHSRAERLGDLEGSVVALKRALALDPASPDVMGELALMLLRRAPLGGGDDDRMRAADLLYQIASQSGAETALGYCEAALDAWPEHEEALDLFEAHCRTLGRDDLLLDRHGRLAEALAQSPAAWTAYRRLGDLAYRLGERDKAIAAFEALKRLGDEDVGRVLEELYRETGRISELAALMTAELASNATAPVASDPSALPKLRELVALLRAQGRDEEAEARMRDILGLAPGDPEATSYLERRFRARGDWPGLFALLMAAGRSRELPGTVRVVRLREAAGIAEERIRDSEGAIACYSLATVLEPDDPEIRRHLERLLVANERWDDLIDRLEADAARAVSPAEKIRQLRRIAEMHTVRRGDVDSAADTYRRILELSPDDREALEALDEIYLRLGDWQQLVEVLGRRVQATAISAEKASLDLRIGAILHEQLERPEEAYSACERALAEVPDKAPALARMEAIDTISGNWARLLGTLRYRADQSDEEERAALLARSAGIAAERLGDHELSRRLWEQVLELRAEDPAALSGLAACFEALGHFEDALGALRRLAEASARPEEQLEVRRRVARLLEENGDRLEAVAAWREVSSRADDPEALTALARHSEAEGNSEELVEVLGRLAGLLEDAPEQRADVLLRRARALAGPLGRSDEAIATLERLLQVVDPRCREALELARHVHASRGDYRAAAETAERELELVEDLGARTELLLQTASWYRTELRDPKKAVAANEKVLELDPYRSDVIAALEELYVETEDWERLLRLTRARYKAASEAVQLKALLVAGAEICETRLGDASRAWGWYRELFDRLGSQPGVLAEVEAAAERLGLGHEIVEVYGELTKAEETELAQAGWWKKIGQVYAERLDDPGRALEAVLRGYALDPNDDGILERIDELALAAGAHDRLLRVYEALLERESDLVEQVALRKRLAGVMLRQGGRPAIAFDQLVEALELVPDDVGLLLEIEKAARASGRHEDLLDIYESHRDLARDPATRVDLLLRSAVLVEENLGAPDRAFGYLIEALGTAQDDEATVRKVDELIEKLESRAPGERRGLLWRRLSAHYRELARRLEDDPDGQVRYLGRVAEIEESRLGEGRTAFDICRQASLLKPGHGPTLDRLERLASEHLLWRELAAHYASALEVVLDRKAAIELHRRRGRALADELDRKADAVEHYWQLIQIDPADADSRARLASIYEAVGRWNDLVTLLERELPTARAARRREILRDIARIWDERLKNAYEAKEAYERILSEFPDDEVAEAALGRLDKPAARAGSLDDDALAELGLLEDASAPPPAFSRVPDDYLTAGLEATAEPGAAAGSVDGSIEELDLEPEEDLESLEELDLEPMTEPEAPPPQGPPGALDRTEAVDLGPDGAGSGRAGPENTSEIDVSEVEEVIESVSAELEDRSEEIDLTDFASDPTGPRPRVPSRPPPPPPAQAPRPSRPPPLPPKK